jgi:hypothetical protein
VTAAYVRPPFKARAVRFDGTNDCMLLGGGLPTAADSKLLTGSVWLRKQGSDGSDEDIVSNIVGATGAYCRLRKVSGNRLAIQLRNVAAGTVICLISSSTNITVANGWQHIAFSVDLADTGKRHIYRNDASDLALVTTYTNDTVDFTADNWSIGSGPGTANKFDGEVADLMLWPGAYLDLSVEANRRLFIDAGGKPVDPGPYGTRPGLGVPALFLRGPANSFHQHKGTGGSWGFTVTGALTEASTSPSD